MVTIAKRELSKENPHNPFFRHIEAEVYCDLTDEQAVRLARRHNVNGHFVHKVTFGDLVSFCIYSCPLDAFL